MAAWLGARGSGTADRATAVSQASRAMALLGFSTTLAVAYLDRCFLAYGRLRSDSSNGPGWRVSSCSLQRPRMRSCGVVTANN
jgi:hypothetical protein